MRLGSWQRPACGAWNWRRSRRVPSPGAPAVLRRTPQASSAGLGPPGIGPVATGRAPSYGIGQRLPFTSLFHAPARTWLYRRCRFRGAILRACALAPPDRPAPPAGTWWSAAKASRDRRATQPKRDASTAECSWASSTSSLHREPIPGRLTHYLADAGEQASRRAAVSRRRWALGTGRDGR